MKQGARHVGKYEGRKTRRTKSVAQKRARVNYRRMSKNGGVVGEGRKK